MSEPQNPDWMVLGRLAELGLLSASLIHELRQPLTALKGLAQMESVQPGVHGQVMPAILEQVGHIEELLAAYGGYGRPMGAAEEPTELNKSVEAVARVMRPMCARSGVTLELAFEATPRVGASAVSVRQVLINVVQNALDASTGSEGATRIWVTTRSDEAYTWAVVRDEGPGLASEELERVGELFWTTKNEGQGTGLGLPIVKRLMEASGGVVRFEHPTEGGLEVWLGWPYGGSARIVGRGERGVEEEGLV